MNVKPIIIIKSPKHHEGLVEYFVRRTENQYYVLNIVLPEITTIEFQVFSDENFKESNYEELKEMITEFYSKSDTYIEPKSKD